MSVKFQVAVFMFLLCEVASDDGQCPTLPGQIGDPQDLNIAAVNVFIDPQDLDFIGSRLYFIMDGVVTYPFHLLSTLSNPVVLAITSAELPINMSTWYIPLQVMLTSDQTLYYSISLDSIHPTIAPPGCPSPQLGELSTVVDVNVTCESQGTVIQQVCLTIGTQPFEYLNGTYHTFTFFFPIICAGSSPPLCPIATPPKLLVNMCITPNQSFALVQSGAGSWSVLASVLRVGDLSTSRGYCIIDDSQDPPGVIILLLEDKINMQYAIPQEFDNLEVYFSRNIPSIPLSYSVNPVSENTSVLDHPVVDGNGVPFQGVTYDERVDFVFDLTCKNPGLSRIYVNFNVSGVINGILYANNYPDLYFYRNCTSSSNETIEVIANSNNLGIEVGVPLTIIFFFLVGGATLVLFLMVYFTRQYRHKAFQLEQEHQLELLASSNAYMLSNFNSSLDSVSKYNLEYNYSSLEVVGELGEGAFGRVFKAIAPGLEFEERQQSNFVAIKTLKECTDLDVMMSFIAEVKTSAQFDHPNVVKLVGICTETPQKCMIFEFMDLGSLNDLLRRSDPNNITESSPKDNLVIPELFLPFSLQVAQGLAYLATLKYVHRDIATRNCLVNQDFVVKIADFGLSREVCGSDYYKIGSGNAMLPVRWMPPEALLYGKFTAKSDVWSFGVLMWEIYTYAHQPYGGISNYEVIDRIKNGQILDCPDLCPASVFDIVKKCWTKVPQRRATIASILKHMGHLLRSNSMNELDDYTRMGTAEGYLNLNFGVVAREEELKEKKRVDFILERVKIQQEQYLKEIIEKGDVEMKGSEDAGGEMRGSEDVGGEMRGSEDAGGEMRGSEDAGGEMRGSEDAGGEMRGSEDAGGEMRGSEDAGGEMRGSEDAGGEMRGSEDAGEIKVANETEDLQEETERRGR